MEPLIRDLIVPIVVTDSTRGRSRDRDTGNCGVWMSNWRGIVLEAIEIGRCLARLDALFRDMAARQVVSDEMAAFDLDEAVRAARRLVRAIEGMRTGALDELEHRK